MNLLLDTHVALWAIADSPALPAAGRALIADPGNEVWVSAVSVWEIAIKHALDRGDMPVSGEEALQWFGEAGYRLLSITPAHAAAVGALPPHHQDPFDRLLLAQAQVEGMTLLTADDAVGRYGSPALQV